MPGLITPLVYALAFLAVVIAAQSIADLLLSSRDRKGRVNRRLTMLDAGIDREAVYTALVRKARVRRAEAGGIAGLQDAAATYVAQAGLTQTPLQLLGIAGAVAAALWLVALSLTHGAGLLGGLMSMVGAAAIALSGVWLWVRRKRNLRIKAIEQQLPMALDIVNRAIRAGHPVISAVHLAAEELGDPIGSEFGLIVDETTYGVDFKEALSNFAHRTGSSDGHFFAVCVSIQSETGGNLAEILEGLASVIRGRHSLGLRVKALASEGRASALLLSILPVFVVGVQLLVHPRVYADKFADPIFWPVVGLTAFAYLSGWAMVQRIINFRY